MIVTDLQYHLETRYVKKLDIMCKRCTNPNNRKDALLIIEGSEGEGKTNASEATAYYIKHKTGMNIYMFFRLHNLIEFAKTHTNCIIIWDEPALDSLSTDWYKEISRDLIRLLMTCRKKRHFFIFNFVKFFKFNEYIVVDRALGLVHIYTNPRTNRAGRLAYIRQKNLQDLWTDYKSKKKRNYKHYRAFGGGFVKVEEILGKMGITIEGVPNCDLDMYEDLKDKAIDSIRKAKPETDKGTKKLNELKKKLGKLKCPILTKESLSNQLGINVRTLLRWGEDDTTEENDMAEGQI